MIKVSMINLRTNELRSIFLVTHYLPIRYSEATEMMKRLNERKIEKINRYFIPNPVKLSISKR